LNDQRFSTKIIHASTEICVILGYIAPDLARQKECLQLELRFQAESLKEEVEGKAGNAL